MTAPKFIRLGEATDALDDEPLCLATAHVDETFVCTRAKDHDGAHVAHIPSGRPVAVWFDEEIPS